LLWKLRWEANVDHEIRPYFIIEIPEAKPDLSK